MVLKIHQPIGKLIILKKKDDKIAYSMLQCIMLRKCVFIFIILCFSFKSFAFENLFIEGALHRYIVVSGLKDYTQPKPGWDFGIGYGFFNKNAHSLSATLHTGHNVISGSNPLVRMLDIYPITVGLSYSYTPSPPPYI